MTILALDPGPTMTAYVALDQDGGVRFHAKRANEDVMTLIEHRREHTDDDIVIEMIASYGMPVGAEVFETCVWIGRYWQAAGIIDRLYRKDVKMHLCHSMKANDAAIRCALIDRYGPGKDKAIGTKKNPGPLYGIKADVWAALAVAVTWKDLNP